MRRAAIVVSTLLVALLAGGCGDGSLDPGALRTQASAICTRSAAATARVALPNSTDEGARFLTAGAAGMRPALAALRTLKPPSDLRSSYGDALHARAQELALIDARAASIAHGADTIATFRTLATQLAPLTRLEEAAWRALGIPACVPR